VWVYMPSGEDAQVDGEENDGNFHRDGARSSAATVMAGS
jgi:hypothetical protein